jgi:hypothetical protein
MNNDPLDDDDFDDEAEALERYPFLAEQREDASQSAADTRPNYHYLHRLKESDIKQLDFHRYDNLFAARTANHWLGERQADKPLRRLFSGFWNEGELGIFFADTGKGKSVLAVQIAQSIASGVSIDRFGLDVPSQRVVYFDFELSASQFAARYDTQEKEPFHNNFIRSPPRDIDELPHPYTDYTEFLTDSMISFIEFSAARVVIVDNITWLNTGTHNASVALRLMKALQRLKKRFGLSILVLAHTPKRSGSSPITINDLQGSKMLANFADNIFAMGASQCGPDIRYLIHLKNRSGPMVHDAQKVCTIRIGKTGGMLGFTFVGHDRERDHVGWLGSQYDPERYEKMQKARDLSDKGLTQREIAKKLGISAATVNRYLSKQDV